MKKNADKSVTSEEINIHKKNVENLENTKRRLEIEQRKRYAEKSFRFMARYTAFATLILLANGLKIVDIKSPELVAFMGTISASMVLFGWVLKGLFDGK